jgi:streptogramin lyase
MIAIRFRLIAPLAAAAIGAAGCSSASSVLPDAISQSPLTSPLAKERVKITEYADLPVYSDYYGPTALTSGPQNSLWVTDTIDQDFGENAVVQIATSGKALNVFYYGGRTSEGADFMGIAAGPDGALWITDFYNEQIVRMTTAGQYTGFPLNNFDAPVGIAAGPDKALWFTAQGGGSRSEIGRITTGGKVTEYSTTGSPDGIVAGPDKALWYAEDQGAIGRITTKGKITEFTKGITAGSYPLSIAPGPDGALWFTEYLGGRIGRITTAGKVTEYSHGITAGEYPDGIVAGPDGAMWFTESEGNGSGFSVDAKIGHITMSGKITEYSKGLTSTADPTGIVQGPDRSLWFVESAADKTGEASL